MVRRGIAKKWSGIGWRMHILWLAIPFMVFMSRCNQNTFDLNLWDDIHWTAKHALFSEADHLKLQGDWESSINSFHRALEESTTIEDSLYALAQLAYIESKLQRMDGLDDALKAFTNVHSKVKNISSSILGDYHFSMTSKMVYDGNITGAFSHMDSTFLYYREVYPEDHWKLIQANNVYGHLLFDFGLKLEKAFEPWTKAYFAVSQLNMPEQMKAEIYATMIWYNLAMRNLENAIEFADLALDALSNTPLANPDILAKSLNGKAMCLKYQKKYEEAHRVFQEAFTISEQVNSLASKRVLNELMYNYYRLDDQQKLPYYDSLMYVYETRCPTQLYMFADQHFGFREFIKGNHEESAIFYERLLESALSNKIRLNSLVQMEAFYILSVAYSSPLNIEQSIQWSLRKFAFYADYPDSLVTEMVHYPVEVLSKVKNAFVSTELLSKQLYLQYQFTGDIDHLRSAAYYYDMTDQLFLKGLISNDQSSIRTFFNDLGYQFYTDAITVHLELKQKDPMVDQAAIDDLIFAYFERLKSHLWLRSKANQKEVGRMSQQIDQLVWKNARQGLTTSEKKELTSLKIKYLLTTDSLQQLNSKLSVADPYTLKTSYHDIRRALTEDDVMITYNLYNNRMQIATLTLDTLVFSDREYSEEQLDALDSLRSCLVATICPFSKFSMYSLEVRKLLLDPIESVYTQKNRMIIVPDRKINLIPFEVLLENPSGTKYTDAPFLIKSKELLYTPSCKIHSRFSQVSLHPERLTAFYYGDDRGGLPCAKYEIKAIEKVFPGNKTRILHSGKSNSQRFLQELERPTDIVHISLHAKSSDLSIYDNYILFGDQFQDTLYGFELGHSQIAANLVVLSACESGYGYYHEAEGMYSLTRYIQQAGASKVLSSLWVVDDCIASKVLQTFYQGLQENPNPSQAIRLAKLNHLANSDDLMAFPGYWAAMVVIN